MLIIYNPQLNSVCTHVMWASYICTCVQLCLYVPVHVHMCSCVCVHMYMCALHGETRSQCWVPVSVPLRPTYLKQALLLDLELMVQLDWLAGKSQESPESHLLPEIGYRCVLLCPAFMWQLGIWTQFLEYAQQVLYQMLLPSPQIFIYCFEDLAYFCSHFKFQFEKTMKKSGQQPFTQTPINRLLKNDHRRWTTFMNKGVLADQSRGAELTQAYI